MNEIDFKYIFREWFENLEDAGSANEWEVKQLLKKAGLSVPDEFLIRKGMETNDGRLEKYIGSRENSLFALKICSSAILHKTDVGGVVLGVTGEKIPEAIRDFRERFGNVHLLLSRMVAIEGPEFILGAMADPVLGPAVMAGAGGILTELYKDVAFRLAPCSETEAGNMLEELTIAPVLSGYRGSTMSMKSLTAYISVFSLLSEAVVEGGAQIDINPLVWNGADWLILDAKMDF